MIDLLNVCWNFLNKNSLDKIRYCVMKKTWDESGECSKNSRHGRFRIPLVLPHPPPSLVAVLQGII